MEQTHFYAVGLDAGSAHTRCVICALEQSRLRFLGFGETRSEGWVKGRISDQTAVMESVQGAVQEAELRAEVSVGSAVVGLGGPTVRGGNSRSRVELGRPREIAQRDVNRAVQRAARVQLQEDRMVLQLFPQDFVVDDQPGHQDPRQMIASCLEANAHLITASIVEHNALVSAVNQAHLAVDETVYEPLAAGYAAVMPEERREGVAVVDIGAQSTGMVVYYGDALQLASSLPVGGDHFTRDVAACLYTGFEDAELLKEEYGCALADFTSAKSWIEIPCTDDREPREAPRLKLNQILEARAQELFRYINRELARAGMERALVGGVVLTGGGATLAGMCDIAERLLNCQARKGLVMGIKDWPEEIDQPQWTTAAGLAMYAARLRQQGELAQQSLGLLGRILKR